MKGMDRRHGRKECPEGEYGKKEWNDKQKAGGREIEGRRKGCVYVCVRERRCWGGRRKERGRKRDGRKGMGGRERGREGGREGDPSSLPSAKFPSFLPSFLPSFR
jgi:hypothetical protein